MINPIIKIDPKALAISSKVNESKIASMARKKPRDLRPCIVFGGNDGTFYVADGNNRATLHARNGRPVPSIIVEDDYTIGKQSAL